MNGKNDMGRELTHLHIFWTYNGIREFTVFQRFGQDRIIVLDKWQTAFRNTGIILILIRGIPMSAYVRSWFRK